MWALLFSVLKTKFSTSTSTTLAESRVRCILSLKEGEGVTKWQKQILFRIEKVESDQSCMQMELSETMRMLKEIVKEKKKPTKKKEKGK